MRENQEQKKYSARATVLATVTVMIAWAVFNNVSSTSGDSAEKIVGDAEQQVNSASNTSQAGITAKVREIRKKARALHANKIVSLDDVELDPVFDEVIQKTGEFTPRDLAVLASAINTMESVIGQASMAGASRPSRDLMGRYQEAQQTYYHGMAQLSQERDTAGAQKNINGYLSALAKKPGLTMDERNALKRTHLLNEIEE